MRRAIAVSACLISVALSSKALAQDPACNPVSASGAGFVVECGKQLYSYNLGLTESKLSPSGIKREVGLDLHGRFAFSCPVVPMCANEPTVGGFFITPAEWLSSSKDAQAIFQVLRKRPWPGGNPPPIPSASCPVFDVSIGGLNGRAVCLSEGKGSIILVVTADDRVGFLLHFFQDDKPAAVLKDKVLEMLPRFEIERASGEVGLKRFLR
jgi:hypothetical protein